MLAEYCIFITEKQFQFYFSKGILAAAGDRDLTREKGSSVSPLSSTWSLPVPKSAAWWLAGSYLHLTARAQSVGRPGSWYPGNQEPTQSREAAVGSSALRNRGLGQDCSSPAAMTLCHLLCEMEVLSNGLWSSFHLNPTISSLTQCSKSLFLKIQGEEIETLKKKKTMSKRVNDKKSLEKWFSWEEPGIKPGL